MEVTRHEHSFESRGVACAGWLYLPAEVTDPPVVVMAHGFGGERTWRLPAFAEWFAERGLAVFLFDYRTFGASDGVPRNLVDPFRHRTDWLAAVEYVRSLPVVDGTRIALWGTSFSGGHVVEVAARVDAVSAVVAQIPFVDGPRTALHRVHRGGVEYLKRGVAAGLRDFGRALTGRRPYYVPLAGHPDEFAVLNTPDALRGIQGLIPDDEDWDNRCPARVVLTALAYRPVARASAVDAPVFVAQATDDTIIPESTTDRLVRELDDVERVRYPLGHFDLYRGEPFETLVERETEFLLRHLRD
ncbi:alpha/beta hydrolase [Salinigranum salinum]|uniref:alpha/beta hydrolase n=1 Tax=Salinigranum salinum TaxID=1364937 RepID=UPI0012611F17|nr:alpha/beta hydrolase [Salinigranum salinum]